MSYTTLLAGPQRFLGAPSSVSWESGADLAPAGRHQRLGRHSSAALSNTAQHQLREPGWHACQASAVLLTGADKLAQAQPSEVDGSSCIRD
ncbi:hypothetical protein WJX73_010386 [Symbiochloris irregularis]|uniref:Uncharacterized protein n=1 Tax=Symbiochloris irregularis TaxID=706552 RepID=A0AAW1P0Y7_9CHLO